MASSRSAVLLVNLGSPRAPDAAAVGEFLEEFLSDRRVVDLNPWLWDLLRKRLILPRRSPRVALAYASIWTLEGSPLIAAGIALRDGVRAALGGGTRVELAMRYGQPSLASVLEALARDGVQRVRLVPLFPQYSETTSGSILESARAINARLARPMQLDPLRDYHSDPGYIAALAASVRESVEHAPVDHYVWSFHGLPVRYVKRGDPYAEQSLATARLLARELGLADEQWSLVWQSRFGPERWLTPAADRFVPKLAKSKPRVLIACPGFAADCLETLEEIGQRLRDDFQAQGGRELRLVPCLNARSAWVSALARLVQARSD